MMCKFVSDLKGTNVLLQLILFSPHIKLITLYIVVVAFWRFVIHLCVQDDNWPQLSIQIKKKWYVHVFQHEGHKTLSLSLMLDKTCNMRITVIEKMVTLNVKLSLFNQGFNIEQLCFYLCTYPWNNKFSTSTGDISLDLTGDVQLVTIQSYSL